MFWKLVKYELQSVRKWYLGIYGIAILLSIPLGLMLQKFIFVTEQSHQLILSKLLVAFILDIISSLVILLSIGIIAAFCLDMKDILLATSYFGQILKEIGAFYLFIPSTILSMIAGILFYYLCISIGNLFNTNKVLMGFVAFFAIQAILFFIGFFFGLGAALTGDATYTAINNSSYIISLVQSLILIAASYFGTYYIMTKRLNLD